jgi:anti-sigma regulatory factor (Ser/Thr protein kinase)
LESLMEPIYLELSDPSQVSAARLEAQRMARALDFDETAVGRISIAVTEVVTNALRHGGGGGLVVQSIETGGVAGLEVVAIDRGRGMPDYAHSEKDGVSTGGTRGSGLGAMRRQSDELDVYTRTELGTIVRMAFWRGSRPALKAECEVGAIRACREGEAACGDSWGDELSADGSVFLVADGLGHGPEAARASALAVETMRRHPTYTAVRLLDAVHGRLRATRGAAAAAVRHEAGADTLAYAGVGNIAACVIDGAARRAMVSHNGILGHKVHKSEEYHYPWPRGSLIVAHSDGLESQWSLDAFPGAVRCHPTVIAALLFREHWRKRDDVVVVVARRTN